MGRNLLFKEVENLKQVSIPSEATSENETFGSRVEPYQIYSAINQFPPLAYKTLYLNSDIGIVEQVPKLTGVYLPVDFSGQNQLDVILYFHGLVKGICKDNPEEFRKRGVVYYWQPPSVKKPQPDFQLRELLNRASRKAILIVPTLGTNSQRDFGKLNQGAFFDTYLNRILQTLVVNKLVPDGASWHNIILAGHSAGGKVMQDIIKLKTSQSIYARKIQECWGLDCFYYGMSGWKAWLTQKKPDQRLLAFHTGNGKSALMAKSIKRFAVSSRIENVFEKSMGKQSEHCTIVSKLWQSLINDCPFLDKL